LKQIDLKLLALKGGVLPFGSALQPGKDFFQFHIAPLDPALKGGAFGEQTGQTSFGYD